MGFGTASISSPRINQLSIQSSSLGLPITLGWGTGRVRCNLIWYNDFTATPHTTKSGGKGGGVKQTTYTYTASIIMGLCAGEVSGVPTIYRDKDVFKDNEVATVWDGSGVEVSSQSALEQAGLNLATGSTTQTPWGYLTSMHPDQALAYRGLAYLYAQDYALNETAAIPNHSFEVQFSVRVSGLPDANPKDVTVDLLTNPLHGLPGWSTGLIGDLTNWSSYCLANNLLISPMLDTARPARDLINEWCEITNSAAFWSEGLLKVGTYGDASATANGVTYTPDLTPIYALTEDDFIPIDDYIPVSVEIRNQSDAFNIVQVEFLDRSNQYNVAVSPSQDLANIGEYGKRKQDPVNWHAICDSSVARLSSQLLLQRTLYRRELYTFKLPWNYVLLDPMDYVSLTTTTDQLKLNNKLVQIISIEENEDDCLTFIAEAVNVGSGSSPMYNAYTGDAVSVQTQITPVPVSPPVMVNAPSSLTGLDPEVWIAVAGANANWGGCEVWISADNVSYQKVGTILAPAKIGSSTAILPDNTDPDTTHTLPVDMSLSDQELLSSSSANANSGSTLFVLENEIMAYQTATLTSANNYNLTTLRRGLYGTAHTSHPSGSKFARLDDAVFKISYTDLNFGETMYIKLPSFNSFGLTREDLSATVPYSIALLNSTEAVDWRVVADQKAITGFLTNESHTVASASDGTGYSLTTAGGTFKVYNGDTDVTTSALFSVVGSATKNGLAIAIGSSTGVYTLSGASWTSDSETFTLQAVYGGVTIQKDYSISKSKAGVDGAGSPLIFLAATAQTFTYDGTGTASPSSQTITFTATLQNLTGTPTFTATGYNSSGTSLGPITLGGTGNTRTMTNTQFGSAAYAVVTASLSGQSDTVTVVKLKDGASGTSGLNNGLVYLYQRAATSPTAPSGTFTYTFATGVLSGGTPGSWTQIIPTTNGNPLWVIVATASSSSATDTIAASEFTSPVKLAEDGATGATGAAGLNSASVFLYQRAASAPAAPSTTLTYTFATGVLTGTLGSWTQTIPSGSDPLYVTLATAASTSATDTIANTEWSTPTVMVQNGAAGANGLNNAVVYIYQRAASAPTLPSVNVTYTFATGAVAGLNNGWSAAIPSGTNPLYVSAATASNQNATDTITPSEWSTSVVLAQNGTDGSSGINTATVYLFQRTTGSTPSLPSTATTYTFATGVATGFNNGWNTSVPTSGGSSLWVTTATALGTGATDTIASTEWAPAALLAQNGVDSVTVTINNSSAQVFAYADGTVPSWTAAAGQLKVYNGSTDVTTSSTLSSSGSAGVTGSINSSGAYSVTGMTGTNGTLTLTAVYGGVTYTRVFSVAKLLTGYEIVGALPTDNLFQGRMVFLTTNNKLYRYTGSAWTPSVAAVDITGQITETQITDDAVTTAKIAANAVTASEIAANTITAGQIATNAITSDEISAGAVTAAKISVTSLSSMSATIGTLQTATTGARMVIQDNVIKVYDSDGVTVRVQIGNLAL